MSKHVRVHVMHTGKVKVDVALPYKELEKVPPVNLRGEAYQIWLPMSSYLIEHPEGRIVVDAGWHEDVRTSPEAHLGAAAGFVEYELPAGWSIREQLQSRGLAPSDIDLVAVSHLDVDHISGLALLNGARRFWVSKPELAAVKPFKKAWYEGLDLEPYPLEEIPFGPYRLGKDVFGDGSVFLVHTPGHTVGQFSVLARLQKGWLLLASDVGYSRRSWKELILPGVMTDKEQALQSLKWVKEFANRTDCVAVLTNHDPVVVPVVYA